jgi:hypothetical protein
MDSSVTPLVLRAIHIVAGAFWVGAALFLSFFLIPSLRGAGPAAGGVMQQLVQTRRLPLWMMGATVLTILSGIALYWRDSAGFGSAWLGSGQAKVFGLGGLLAIVGAAVGMGVSSPSGRRMAAIMSQAAGRAPTAAEAEEMQRLQAKMAAAGQFVSVLVLLATLAMAIARYVP